MNEECPVTYIECLNRGTSILLHSVPTVPQAVSALSTGSTTMLVTWTGPAVSFREHMHTTHVFIYVQYNGTVLCCSLPQPQVYTTYSFLRYDM